MRATAPSLQEPLGRSERFQCRHPALDAAQDRSEAAHGAVQAHAVARFRARDEAGVAIPLAVVLRVRAARLPECGQLRARHWFVAEDADLFVDLKPRHLVLLKKDVARVPLLRCVKNAIDVLGHDFRNFYHAPDTWQALLTDLEPAEQVLLLACCGVLSASSLVRPGFDRFSYFLIMFIVGLLDAIYGLPEDCSIVSNEICSLQRLCAFMYFAFAFRIGIGGGIFFLTSR